MTVSKTITPGNIVSWVLLVITFALGWASMRSTAATAASTAVSAMRKAEEAKDQAALLHSDIRVINVKLDNQREILEDIKARISRQPGYVSTTK